MINQTVPLLAGGKLAQTLLKVKVIMHKGERFDGGAAATWATRSHRAFTVHAVAVIAARATCRAITTPDARNCHSYNPRNLARRTARMKRRVT